jgi:gamma-glutamyl-gamma-aminobutyrate hydrolase PuuD
VIGVQWHPEEIEGDPVISGFIETIVQYRRVWFGAD